MNKNKIAVILIFCCLGLFFVAFGFGFKKIQAWADAKAEVEQEVKTKLDQEKEVPVVILLKEDFEIKGEKLKKLKLGGVEEINERKEKVEADLDKILSKLADSDFKVDHKYKVVKGFSGKITKSGLKKLSGDNRVKNIFLDKQYNIDLAQSVPLINADDAWTSPGVDGTGQAVCVIDGGVDYNHVDLGGPGFPNSKVLGGYDFVNDDADPIDDNSHGTHVAGIVASTNATYRGVAPGADIVAMKVLDAGGTGYGSDITAAIDWCIDYKSTYGISVINMSIGDDGEYNDPISQCSADSISQSITLAKAAGITTFVASGNDVFSNGINYPACAPDAISVGATYDANIGGISWTAGCTDSTTTADKVVCITNSDEILDMMAPGAMTTSTNLGGGTTNKGGTSMASPHAAGAAALMLENNSDLNSEEIRCSLKETGVSVTDSKNGLSFPRIEILGALSFAPTISGDTSWTGGYQLYDHLGSSISSGSTVDLTESLYIKDASANNVVKLEVDCNVNLGTDISVGSDIAQSKAFIHNLANKTSVADVTLYIPKDLGHDQVKICPGAQNLSEVNSGCAGGFVLSASNPDYNSYHLDDTDPDYWIVSGVQNTGGLGEKGGASIPEFTIATLLIAAVLGAGSYLVIRKRK